MTVGIGVLCHDATIAVVASDMRATFPKSQILPHDVTGKQWDFDVSYPVAACVAGKLGICQPLVDELSNYLARKLPRKGNVYCEHIENAINYARYRTFRRYADWSVKMTYCMTLREWQRGKVPGGVMNQMIHDEVKRFVDGLSFPAELIVAGFLMDGNLLFYKASGKKHLEASSTPGVCVIGTGGQIAMNHLNKRGQNLECGLSRTLLHISEALDEARNVSDESVGKPMGFTIMFKDGKMARIRADAPFLRDWKAAYKNRDDTGSLDYSDIAMYHVRAQLNSDSTGQKLR